MSLRIEAARLVRKHEAARALIHEADADRAAVKDSSMDPQPNLEAWYLRLQRADHALTVARGAFAEARGDAVLLLCQSEDDAAIDAAHAYMDAGIQLEKQLARLADRRTVPSMPVTGSDEEPPIVRIAREALQDPNSTRVTCQLADAVINGLADGSN